MYEDEIILLKVLHVALKLPIVVFDMDFNYVKEYKSNRAILPCYNFKVILKKILEGGGKFSYVSGEYSETFLVYIHNNNFFIFGPFMCNRIDKEMFDSKMQYKNIKNTQKELIYETVSKMPLFSLGDTRDILLLVNYLFTGKIEDLMCISTHECFESISKKVKLERINSLLSQNYDSANCLFLYEKRILKYVEQGDVDKLKELIVNLSNSVVPSITGDSIRSEKNYSIIVFEKLSQAAIELGMDIIDSYISRDSFIRETEFSTNLNKVLKIRNMAIVYYTSEVRKTRVKKLSPLVSSIVQYIGLNMYTKISVKEIAQYFSMSEAKLRLSFKREMEINIHTYILRKKISEAKVMLKDNNLISDVALLLGFCDSSHFSKVFKNLTGTTPKQYQMSLDSKQQVM